jgi:hypothetical protein
MRVLKEP